MDTMEDGRNDDHSGQPEGLHTTEVSIDLLSGECTVVRRNRHTGDVIDVRIESLKEVTPNGDRNGDVMTIHSGAPEELMDPSESVEDGSLEFKGSLNGRIIGSLNGRHADALQSPLSPPSEYPLDPNRPLAEIKVYNVTPAFALGRYEVYEHIIPDSVDSCRINYGGSIQEIPVLYHSDNGSMGAKTTAHVTRSVFVYMCKDEPLLIYIKGRKRWLKKGQGGPWEVLEYPPSNEFAYSDIVSILDEMESPCGPPRVIIDISKKEGVYTDPDDHQIRVVKKVGPQNQVPANYIMYDHTIEDRSHFTITKAKCGEEIIDVIQDVDKVTKVSVFYWENDHEYNMPLVMRISRMSNGDVWSHRDHSFRRMNDPYGETLTPVE